MAKKFSPPYGDGTKKFEIELGIHQFSPPYGDGTMRKYAITRRSVFSPPLRGLYQEPRDSGREAGVIVPLRGSPIIPRRWNN